MIFGIIVHKSEYKLVRKKSLIVNLFIFNYRIFLKSSKG
jgi:hypothetical protein